MTAVLISLLTLPAFCQSGNPVIDGLNRAVEMRGRVDSLRALDAQRRAIREQDRREQEEHDARMKLMRRQLDDMTAPKTTGAPPAQTVSPDLIQAVAKVQGMYPDFSRYGRLMNIVAESIPLNATMSTAEYIEILYLVAKHASFAAEGRRLVLGEPSQTKPLILVDPSEVQPIPPESQ